MNDRNAPYSQAEMEQFARIGACFFGAARATLRQMQSEEQLPVRERTPERRGTLADLVKDPIEKQIVQYLAAHVESSRRELRAVLGLSSATIARKTARLRAAGLVVSTGRTRTACYSLRGPEQNN